MNNKNKSALDSYEMGCDKATKGVRSIKNKKTQKIYSKYGLYIGKLSQNIKIL